MKNGDARSVRGFTMIELIVVMSIIGLLLSIAVPRYFQALERGKRQVQQQNLSLMRDAIDKYFGDTAHYPERLEDLVTKRYLRAILIDPVTEAADWEVIAPPDPALGGVYDVQSSRSPNPEDSGAPVTEITPAGDAAQPADGAR